MENLFQFTDKMFGAKCSFCIQNTFIYLSLNFFMYLYKASLLHVPLALDMVKKYCGQCSH